MEKLTIYIAGLLFTAYLIYVRVKLGCFPKSISITIYSFKSIFVPLIAIIATCILTYSYNTVEAGKQPVLAIGAMFLFGVPVFGWVKNKTIMEFHYPLAVLGFMTCLLSLGFDYNNWVGFSVSIILGIIIILAVKKSKIFWLEVVLSYCILLFLM